jgi:hypothetical protein
MTSTLTDQDWQLRLSIYRFFVEHERPPSVAETADRLGFDPQTVRRAYHRLHRDHAILLDAGTDEVRMANPLSAVPTPYRVWINDRSLFANCAWDSLGIPAMLAVDARIDATIDDAEPLYYTIEGGELRADDRFVVHFPKPFRVWYDDLVQT